MQISTELEMVDGMGYVPGVTIVKVGMMDPPFPPTCSTTSDAEGTFDTDCISVLTALSIRTAYPVLTALPVLSAHLHNMPMDDSWNEVMN